MIRDHIVVQVLEHEVVIAGGMLGKVARMSEQYLGVEIAAGVEVQVQRASVVQVLPKGTIK